MLRLFCVNYFCGLLLVNLWTHKIWSCFTLIECCVWNLNFKWKVHKFNILTRKRKTNLKIWNFFSLPWNQTTWYGYFGELITITGVGNVYSGITFVLLIFFVAICLHHQAFYKMFKMWIDAQNEQQQEKNRDNRSDEQFLCDLIRLHISVKE